MGAWRTDSMGAWRTDSMGAWRTDSMGAWRNRSGPPALGLRHGERQIPSVSPEEYQSSAALPRSDFAGGGR